MLGEEIVVSNISTSFHNNSRSGDGFYHGTDIVIALAFGMFPFMQILVFSFRQVSQQYLNCAIFENIQPFSWFWGSAWCRNYPASIVNIIRHDFFNTPWIGCHTIHKAFLEKISNLNLLHPTWILFLFSMLFFCFQCFAKFTKNANSFGIGSLSRSIKFSGYR